MLYTRKGDGGSTKTFGCDQRISKSSAIAEALGALDETNSYLGLVRAKCAGSFPQFEKTLFSVQQNLFTIQAELAGADGKTISEEKIKEVETIVDSAENEMPPIKSFFIPGATELGAMFDVARTVSRRAERRVVAVSEEGVVKIGQYSLAYLNRLSSLLYALARLSNYKSGIKEEAPSYK
jgi:cob(I)alamin adenosyltransferase